MKKAGSWIFIIGMVSWTIAVISSVLKPIDDTTSVGILLSLGLMVIGIGARVFYSEE